MNRFYVNKDQIRGEDVTITGGDVRHITQVLRLSVGDRIAICDGDNTDYDGVIQKTSKDGVRVKLQNATRSDTEAKVKLVLYQAIAKGTKMDYIVQKGTELGIAFFVPVITLRTVVRPGNIQKKIQRWQRIVMEAAKQSGRGRIPTVLSPMDYEDALAEMETYSLSLIPHKGEGSLPIASLLDRAQDYKDIAIMIGPEGGFSHGEIKRAKDKGVPIVNIGPRVLRTETAGIAVAAILMYRFGDLGGEG